MASKIEKLGLVKRIEDLIASGTSTSEAISSALKAEGFTVSQPTISRYLKRTREERREETQKILSDHVQAHVPGDLTALETMEAQCLDWAQEDNAAFAHRLAGRNIAAKLDEWVSVILAANKNAVHTEAEELEDARTLAVKEIMAQAIGFVADEFAVQRARLLAMQRASNIIEMKLRYAGLMGEKEGNVFILGNDDRLEKDENTGRFLVIKGGKD